MISKTLDGVITSWNPAAERIFGYTASEIVGKSITILFPPERIREENELLERIKQGSKIDHFDTIRVHKDGHLVNVRLTLTPIRNESKKIVGATKIAHDLTAWEQSPEKLKLLDTCVAKLNDIILVAEAEPLQEPGPRIVFVNEAFEKHLGYTPQEVLGRSPRFLQGENTDRKTLDEIGNALKNRQPIIRQLINYDKSGREHCIEINVVPIFDDDGKCKYFASIQRDITENEQAREKIAEQAALLDKTHDAISLSDLEGRLLYCNKGAETLCGWTFDEMAGRHMRDLIYKNSLEYDHASHATLEHGKWTSELVLIHKDGHEVVVQAHWNLITDKAGKPKSILRIIYDITDRKKIEAQFMRAQRMESIGTLAGGIAHDLNNILAPILISIDLLKQMVDKPEATQILETIEVSAKRGSDIVRQVLSFARGMDGERIELQPKHLVKDLERVVTDTFPKHINWQADVPKETWTIQADPTQIGQVLLNLCVNARDAMPKGGLLSITVDNRMLDEHYAAMNIEAKPGPYVVFSVTDTGTGIPRDVQNKIFEPFFTTKEIGKGTGLGLSNVMAIVKSHKGFINLYSEPGKGSCFKVFLPAQLTSNLKQPTVEEENLPRGNGETILLVEDEAALLAMTSQTLQAFGYRVLTAKHGAEAVAIYAQKKDEIAVVMTDMMMPVMDGPATISALMSINPEVKIIAASGLGSYSNLTKISDTGVKHFLTKPHTAGALLQLLRKILHGSDHSASSQ